MAAKIAAHGFGDVGIGMNRINQLHTRQIRNFTQRGANSLKTVDKTFKPVSRHYDQLTVRIQIRPVTAFYFVPLQEITYIQNRVDTGIPGYGDPAVLHSLGE